MRAKRGWREHIAPSIYRSHRAACPSSDDHKPSRRCACPYTVRVVTGQRGGGWLTVEGSLATAREALAKSRIDAAKAKVRPRLTATTLHDHAADWFKRRAAIWRPATLKLHNAAYIRRIAPTLGNVPLGELSRARCEAWLADLVAADPAIRSVGQAVETLRAMLSAAVEDCLIEANPAARIKAPRRPPRADVAAERVLTPDQVQRLLERCRVLRSRTLLRCAVETGMRRGELIGLRWPDLKLDERRIEVRTSVWQGKAGERRELTPKTQRARRVAITERLADELAEWFSESVIANGAAADGPVWPGHGGRPLGRDVPGQLLERWLVRAALVDSNGRPLVSVHGLRHTSASIALAAGVPLITVSRQLGHSRITTTAETYAHLVSDSQLDAFADSFGNGGVRRGVRQAGAIEADGTAERNATDSRSVSHPGGQRFEPA